MIRNTVINTLSFFYPLGNTPAVSLTQDLPIEHEAHILLLGCGDARNILFTAFADPGRKLDVTCCDIEPAILARNILLLTLIADHKASDQHIWDIYYHYKISTEAFDTFQNQLELLLSRCQSRQQWDESPYGKWLAFCDERTFDKIVALWKRWCTKNASQELKNQQQHALQQSLGEALELKKKFAGEEYFSLVCVRSASPASMHAVYTLPKASNHWWKTGTLEMEDKVKLSHLNPSLLSPSNPSIVLHYGLEPLGGFQLAPAFVPLTAKSPLRVEASKTSFKPALKMAQIALRLWSQAFQEALKVGSVIRVCAADALAICHTLQAAVPASKTASANLAYDNWSCQPLELDIAASNVRPAAPLRFNVIDSSNLVDHLGALNIISAAAPLLQPGIASTLCTEILVQEEQNQAGQLDALLCGDFKTMSVILGLSPVELWTNATNCSEADEGMFYAVTQHMRSKSVSGKQNRTRVRWKLLPNQSAPTVGIDPERLAYLLESVHNHMYRHESISGMMGNLAKFNNTSMSNPYYTRAGFAALLQFVKKNIFTDWPAAMECLLGLLHEESPMLSVSRNYASELVQYLHLVNVRPERSLDAGPNSQPNTSPASALPLAAWLDIPPLVAVTVNVPRKDFAFFGAMSAGTAGIPVITCSLRRAGPANEVLVDLFSAAQVSFGTLRKSTPDSADADIRLTISDDDPQCWQGTSPLVVSFLVPSSLLMQDPMWRVAISLQTTPHSVMTFAKKLGPELTFFQTALTGPDVSITLFFPNMAGLPRLGGTPSNPVETTDQADHVATISLQLQGNVLSSLTGRLDLNSEASRKNLADKSNGVSVRFPTPLLGEVLVGKKLYAIAFPTPVAGSKNKVRIARKSSYIEVVLPLWDPLGEEASDFMFPTSPGQVATKSSPTSWNSQRLNLEIMPTIDLKRAGDLEWLNPHYSLSFSDRERKLRETSMSSPGPCANTRVELKDGLHSILMQYTGIQGRKFEYFGLATSDSGIHVIIMPACLRLDLVNRTIVVDAAIIPLTFDFLKDKKFEAFLAAGARQGVCHVKVSKVELKCWKAMFPSLVERGRTWSHSPRCEYLKNGAIPLTLKDGETPLCSCGLGKFPASYMQNSNAKLPHFEHVLTKYATRAAISPFFAVSYVESCFLTEYQPQAIRDLAAFGSPDELKDKCNHCGRDKPMGSNSGTLQLCSRCKKVRYCSRDCQRSDWKAHKTSCEQI